MNSLRLRNIKVQLLPRRYKRELAQAERMRMSATDATPEFVERVKSFLRSDSWEVRNSAVKIIARAQCEELYTELVERLLDTRESGILRRNCAELLHELQKGPLFRTDDPAGGLDLQGNELGNPLADHLWRDLQ